MVERRSTSCSWPTTCDRAGRSARISWPTATRSVGSSGWPVITAGQQVVEIGAGLGSLTLALVEAGAAVTAVEIDRHVLPVLRAQVEPLGVRVVEADALRLDWTDLLGGEWPGREGWAWPGADGAGPWALVANLPYNMAVPLVIRVLEEAPQVTSLLVMVQREVGERLAAVGRRRGLRGGVGEGGLLGRGGRRRPGVPLGVHPQATGGVGAGPPGPPARAGR